jgi:lysophospholipase L1-like esterase
MEELEPGRTPQTRQPGVRRPTWWLRAVLLATGLALGLGAAELIVRVAGLAPEIAFISVGRFQLSSNPEIGYEPIPSYEFEGEEVPWFAEFRGRGNSLGFRDREHELAKPEGVQRILAIGDSITMGLQLDQSKDVYTAVLGRVLRRRGVEVEVLNFGVSGYNTQQEVAALIEKGLAYDPDLVLLQYCPNDRELRNGGIIAELLEREQANLGVERSLVASSLARSHLFRFLRYRALPGFRDARAHERQRQTETLSQDTVEASFARLGETSRAEGFEVLVVAFPFLGEDFEAAQRDREAVASYSAANQFSHLDLQSAFERCGPWESMYGDSTHPSGQGHTCAGRAIAKYLLATELVVPE